MSPTLARPTTVTPTQHADMTALLQGTTQAVLSDPATMAVYLDPGFRVRRHLARISRALTRVAEGHTKRLLLMLPPQSGKSTLAAVWLPFWWLARNPAQRVIIGSYGQTLALKRGREIRRLVERHGWKWGLELEWGAKVVTDWSLKAGGGIKSVGVGSGVTGFPADCVVGSTRINTPLGPMRVDDYTDLAAPPKVLSWNHSRSRAEWSRVLATRVISNRRILEVHTRSGKTIRCTPDHRIHTPDGGYRPAADLRPGDQISALVAQPALPGMRADIPAAPQPRDPSTEETIEGHSVHHGMRSRENQRDPHVHPMLSTLHQTAVVHQQVRSGVLFTRLREPSPTQGGAPLPRMRGHGPDIKEGVLLGRMPISERMGGTHMQAVPAAFPYRARGGDEEGTRGQAKQVLLNEVHRRCPRPQPWSQVRTVPHSDAAQPGAPVLLQGVPPWGSGGGLEQGHARRERHEGLSNPAAPGVLPSVRPVLQPQEQSQNLLLPGMREPGACGPDARTRELPVQGRDELREPVQEDARRGDRTGQPPLRRMPVSGEADHVHPQRQNRLQDELPCAPHQRGREGQPTREPDHPVRDVPLSAPPLGNDTVSLVRDLRDEREPVYDLQVEGNSNFFADEVLVHNCAIIDDPHKSRAEADSRTMRDGVWDWYSSDFLTRLAPGGPVVAMLTPWHEDDWAHRVLERDGRVEEGGEWEVVRIPALADSDDDPLGRAIGDPLPHPMLDEDDTESALAHWHERRRQVTARDWGALYQLDPKPSEGALVDRSVLRRQRHTPPPSDPVKAAVAVDPSGGGRDTAGIVGGYLAEDGRLYLTEDATMVGTSEAWARAACELAASINAEVIVVEKNYGGDMARNVIRSAWDALARERGSEDDRFTGLAPQVKMVSAKRGKLLRAEPVAQQLIEDRVRLGGVLPELEEEWASWQPTDPDSPGRIDASCYLVYAVLPVPGAEAVVSSPTGVSKSRAGRPAGARIQRRRV